jgi:hypothetical protein
VPLTLLSLASTKREVYTLISSTPIFIVIALFTFYLSRISVNFNLIYRRVAITAVTIILLIPIRYSLERIKPFEPRFVKQDWRISIEAFRNKLTIPIDSVILVNDPNYIETRFYYDIKSYNFLEKSDLEILLSKGFKIYQRTGIAFVRNE